MKWNIKAKEIKLNWNETKWNKTNWNYININHTCDFVEKKFALLNLECLWHKLLCMNLCVCVFMCVCECEFTFSLFSLYAHLKINNKSQAAFLFVSFLSGIVFWMVWIPFSLLQQKWIDISQVSAEYNRWFCPIRKKSIPLKCVCACVLRVFM